METQATTTHYHVTDARGTPIVPMVYDREAEARAEAIRQANFRYARQWAPVPEGARMIVNGTTYHQDTDANVVRILESFRERGRNGPRIAIEYGDTDTGQPWGDVETGYIGRSTGTIKIPLIIPNIRSSGGPGLLEQCIVRIRYANKRDGGVLYQHSGLEPH